MLFDLDNPGHYMRRLKAVVADGPVRRRALHERVGDADAARQLDPHVHRRRRRATRGRPARTHASSDDPGGTSEIVTSSAQNDAGLFELRLEDERYLPFEGGRGDLDLATDAQQRLPAVRLHDDHRRRRSTCATPPATAVRRCADHAADGAAKAKLNAVALAESRTGLYRLFSARHEYPTNWAQFLDPAPGDDQTLQIDMPPERFPFFTHGLGLKVKSIDVLVNTTDTGPYTLELTTPKGATQTVTMNPDPTLDGMHDVNVALSPNVDLGRAPTPSSTPPPTWTIKLKQSAAADYKSLQASQLDDILLVVSYEASP